MRQTERREITIDGKRYTIRAHTKAELEKKIYEKRKAVENGSEKIRRSKVTVRKWTELCFKQYKTNLAEITYTNQFSVTKKWIIGTLGNMLVKDVRPLHCQQVLNSMEGHGTYSLRQIRQLLRWVFDRAVENNLLQKNPAEHLTVPRGTTTQRRSVTEDERKHILKVADQDPRFTFFLVTLFCGLRPSEVAGLKGMDVKKINNTNILHVQGTKSAAAVRDVPIPDYLMERLPKNPEPFKPLFRAKNGERMKEYNWKALWKVFKRQLNISMGCATYRRKVIPPYRVAEDLCLYCFRHTFCTDLQKKGVDIRTAQYLMGHSSIALTADIYTHADEQTLISAAKLMNQ